MKSILIELLLQWVFQKKTKNKLMAGNYEEDAVGGKGAWYLDGLVPK